MIKLSLSPQFDILGINIDKTKTEFEIFASNFENVDKDGIKNLMLDKSEVGKSIYLSKIIRQRGNKFYVRESYFEALHHYNLSLSYAPTDSVEYGYAIANRVGALLALKRYEECLMDIENIWLTAYPKEYYFKIYARQSACFLNLEQHSKAYQHNIKARRDLIRYKHAITQYQYGKFQYLINSMFEQIKSYDVNYYEYELAKPGVKNGENPKFLNASNCVDLKNDGFKGRYVTANKDIQKGDILFVEEPYSFVRVNDIQYRHVYCAYCLKYSKASIPCNECTIHFYCSLNCKVLAWDKWHKWECRGERKKLFTPSMRLLLNTLLKAAENNFSTVVEDESVHGNQVDDFAFVDKLVTNKYNMSTEDFTNYTKLSIWLVMYLKECTGYFEWLRNQPNNLEKSMPELLNWVGGILLKLCMQIQCNYTDIVDVSITDLIDFDLTYDFIGFGLYPSTAMINHSCFPNAQVSFCENTKIIRATKDIKKDSEITVNYAYFASQVQHVDLFYMMKNYKFLNLYTTPIKSVTNVWLCYACHGRAFSINETEAKCADCEHIISTVSFNQMESNIQSMYLKLNSKQSTSFINHILNKIKVIYHPESEEFIKYFKLVYIYYMAQHDGLKCLTVCKKYVDHCNEHFRDDDEQKVQAYLRLINALTLYYNLTLVNVEPADYNFEDYFLRMLKITTDLLKYFVSFQTVRLFDISFQNQLVSYN